jgi:hypothetical protein
MNEGGDSCFFIINKLAERIRGKLFNNRRKVG